MKVYNRDIIELENEFGFQYFDICHECAKEYEWKIVQWNENSRTTDNFWGECALCDVELETVDVSGLFECIHCGRFFNEAEIFSDGKDKYCRKCYKSMTEDKKSSSLYLKKKKKKKLIV